MPQFDTYFEVENRRLDSLFLEFDRLMMEHKENLLNIHLKLITESGTDEDAEYLYALEAEDTSEKGKGILGSIAKGISNLFHRLKTLLFGVKENDIKEEDVRVEQNPQDLLEYGKNLLDQVRNSLGGKAITLFAAPAVAAGGFLLKGGRIKETLSAMKKYTEQCEREVSGLEKSIEGEQNPEKQEEKKKLLGGLRNFAGSCMKIVKAIPHVNSEEFKQMREDEIEDADKRKKEKAEQKEAEKNKKKNGEGDTDSEEQETPETPTEEPKKDNTPTDTVERMQAKLRELDEGIKECKRELETYGGGKGIIQSVSDAHMRHLDNKRKKGRNLSADQIEKLAQWKKRDTTSVDTVKGLKKSLADMEAERENLKKRIKAVRIERGNREINRLDNEQAKKAKEQEKHDGTTSGLTRFRELQKQIHSDTSGQS